MATAAVETRRSRTEGSWLRGETVKVSWSAIFAGAVVALGIWALLYSLGLALGLSSMDPNNPDSARAAGIGTGIWSVIAPLIALFIGGMVAGRTAGDADKPAGAIHGAAMWAVTTLLGILVLGMALSSLLGGIARLGSNVAGAAGGLASGGSGQQAPAQDLMSSLGINTNDLLGPVNQQLREKGMPPVTANQLQAATGDTLKEALRTGKLDREVLTSSIAENTKLSRADAEQLATQISTQFEQRKDQLVQNVEGGALKVADTTGKVFWGVFGALFLGLIASVLGALVTSRRREPEALPAVTTTPIAPPPAGVTRREVYP